MRHKLAMWKIKFLTKAGRLCLIKSTLFTILACYMQTTFLSVATYKYLDCICNNFLRGDVQGKRNIHLVGKDQGKWG